jgi:predicted amidophosphoribosyltransferase
MRRATDLPPPGPLDACRALLDYEGTAREVVARLKYRNHRASLTWLAAGVAGLLHAGEVDVVTWAPTTDARRRQRGFDHAELLARAVARRHHLPCRALLLRAGGTHQTGRNLAERRQAGGFRPLRPLHGVQVALVDDVVTTGATMAAAGVALRRAGARGVIGLAAARTP